MSQEIKDKRIACILEAWKILGEANLISTDTMHISMPLLNETVEYYLSDMEILKKRYDISDKIQLHKIAGLLVNAIVRIKPIVPVPNVDTFSRDSEIYANEILAIYEGLAICSEYDKEYNITKELWFCEWFDNFIFMLHHRIYTAESLIFIFETISRVCFPKAFLSTPKR
jgi:hypothetical protein